MYTQFNSDEIGNLLFEEACCRADISVIDTLKGPESFIRGRSDQQLFDFALQGHIAEVWAMENLGLIDCDEKYHDLMTVDGEIVEVKASKNVNYLHAQLERIRNCSSQGWNKSKYFIGFLVEGPIYTLVMKKRV